MNPENVPLLGAVIRFGAQDGVLDTILLLGPVIIIALVLFGRNPVTVVLAASYVVSFFGYVLYNGITR